MPIPPWPRSSRISSCGKCGASSIGVGGPASPPGADSTFGAVAVSNACFTRHCGHSPCGASDEIVAPQLWQIGVVFISICSTGYRSELLKRLQEIGCRHRTNQKNRFRLTSEGSADTSFHFARFRTRSFICILRTPIWPGVRRMFGLIRCGKGTTRTAFNGRTSTCRTKSRTLNSP